MITTYLRMLCATQAARSHSNMAATKPVINYFSIAGRGELCRLICAAGGVPFDDKAWAPAFDETGGWRQGYQAIGNGHGLPGTMPVLEHGALTLFQHNAIESYLASIAPLYAGLTPEQKAKDLMIQLTKADVNSATESLLFKKIEAKDLPPMMDKLLPILEGLCPDEGFINGLDFPTPADLAIAVVNKGCMPFQAAMQMAGCATFDGAKYPKMARISKAALEFGPVADFLKTSEHKTLKADPFGIMPAEY